MSRDNESDRHTEHKEISIETLSTPPLRIEPAPLVKRTIAGIIDSLIVGLIGIPVLKVETGPPTVNIATATIYFVGITFGYYFLLEGAFATTVGKSLMRLRVLDMEGDACSWSASFKRNLLRFLDWLPLFYILAGIFILTSRDRRRFGDRVAATIVTKAAQKDVNPPPAPFLFH